MEDNKIIVSKGEKQLFDQYIKKQLSPTKQVPPQKDVISRKAVKKSFVSPKVASSKKKEESPKSEKEPEVTSKKSVEVPLEEVREKEDNKLSNLPNMIHRIKFVSE